MMIFRLISALLIFEVISVEDKTKKCIIEGINMCGYKNHKEMISHLMDIEKKYPDIAKVAISGILGLTFFIPGWIHWDFCEGKKSDIYQVK